MNESNAGDLGNVTWGARLRLDELEADISAAQNRLNDFYQRNEGKSIGVGFGGGGGAAGTPGATGSITNMSLDDLTKAIQAAIKGSITN